MEPDFQGWATQFGLKCSDGVTIGNKAFAHQDKQKVPLVWKHGHDDPTNVLGHVDLEKREQGVWVKAFFNRTKKAKHTKKAVQHGDVDQMSIWANHLKRMGKNIKDGTIREVSLVLNGANPGARIDPVTIAHADGYDEVLDTEAVITTGIAIEIKHEDKDDAEELDAQEIYDTLNDKQKAVVHALLEEALQHDDQSDESDDEDETEELNHEENDDMPRNVFDKKSKTDDQNDQKLMHTAFQSVFETWKKVGSLNEAILQHAEDFGIDPDVLAHDGTYGINQIEMLFPEAKNVNDRPEWIKRRTEWVETVIDGVRKLPFSRIKTMQADITADEARARGYVKGNLKKEEVFDLLGRVTTPQTVYKKQKLDRDDIVDITDFDVVLWIKGEMMLMLREEIARAILIGDGRPAEDPANPGEPNPDKIKPNHIRPIATDHELYAHRVAINPALLNTNPAAFIDQVALAQEFFKGTGTPVAFATRRTRTKLRLAKIKADGSDNRRLFSSNEDLYEALEVSSIVPVEPMESQDDVLMIIVNLQDYGVGSTKGGEITYFSDFDIDYNQEKYLYETRFSGALTKVKSALIVVATDALEEVATVAPTFNAATGVLTVPSVGGVVYFVDGVQVTSGAQPAIAPSESIQVTAEADEGYVLSEASIVLWNFTRDA